MVCVFFANMGPAMTVIVPGDTTVLAGIYGGRRREREKSM